MKIATVGDNCMDVYAKEGKCYPGGNPVNVSVYLRRLGLAASYSGVVGDDEYGEIMKSALREKGVDVSHVRTEHGSTAITQVELVNGDRVFGDYTEGVMEHYRLTDDDLDFLCAHDLVVSGIWGNVDDQLAQVHARGIPLAFDFSNQPQHPVVERTIGFVDYAFFASDEGDTPALRAFVQKMQARGPRYVVVTLGSEGSLAYDGTKFTKGGIVPCDVVDTMGAGDSFIAGFLDGVLKQKPLAECMHMGAANSSVTLAYQGAW